MTSRRKYPVKVDGQEILATEREAGALRRLERQVNGGPRLRANDTALYCGLMRRVAGLCALLCLICLVGCAVPGVDNGRNYQQHMKPQDQSQPNQ